MTSSLRRRFRQAIKLSKVVFLPGALQAFVSWKPFSITAFRMMHTLASRGLNFRTIIDGGANVGQFSRAATEKYPDACIVSVEPLPQVAAILRDNLADRPQIRVVQTALGDHEGSTRFYRNAYSLASSVLPLAEEDPADTSIMKPVPIEVPVTRLDNLVDQDQVRHPFLIKLDLQGYELTALQGATHTLTTADYVLLETSFTRMYEAEPLFGEVYTFMCNAGFHLLYPVDILKDAHGTIVQMDVLFARSGH